MEKWNATGAFRLLAAGRGKPRRDVFTMCAHMSICDVATPESDMTNASAGDRTARDVNINLRASRQQRSLIDRAAEALGKSRSDFMLDAARREAESVLLDRRYFALDAEGFGAFMERLDAEPTDNPELRRLLGEKAPWDR